ncbi:tail fiber assembly protein [Salmonella enterica]|nr:tail fiber assembly protein [Salmonella enterica]EBY5841394.1 phage tail protein [Salmonella enterica subsp. enterica serovar Poona]EBL7286011.1 phage tail protein [Salmonella enterica]EBT3915819.1 tail fiber assembly protein [Salmonella enterica]ECR1056490.1 tail fiber assembly protein [Salmonella enterica]
MITMMKYYKDENNVVYAYDAHGTQDAFIKEGLMPITRSEAMAIINPPLTHEQLIQAAENERQRLLSAADAVMLDWRTELMLGEISDANKAKLSAWLAYKNQVNAVDISEPESITWPDAPTTG